jgi:hypothetical protein
MNPQDTVGVSLIDQVYRLLLPSTSEQLLGSITVVLVLYSASLLPWLAQVRIARSRGLPGFPLSWSYALTITVATIWTVLLGMSTLAGTLVERPKVEEFVVAVPLAFFSGRFMMRMHESRTIAVFVFILGIPAMYAFRESVRNSVPDLQNGATALAIAAALTMIPILAAAALDTTVQAFHVELSDADSPPVQSTEVDKSRPTQKVQQSPPPAASAASVQAASATNSSPVAAAPKSKSLGQPAGHPSQDSHQVENEWLRVARQDLSSGNIPHAIYLLNAEMSSHTPHENAAGLLAKAHELLKKASCLKCNQSIPTWRVAEGKCYLCGTPLVYGYAPHRSTTPPAPGAGTASKNSGSTQGRVNARSANQLSPTISRSRKSSESKSGSFAEYAQRERAIKGSLRSH